MKKVITGIGIFFAGMLASVGIVLAAADSVFPDVDPNAYYADGVLSVYYTGLMTGYSNGNFGPNDPVTRGQLATILKRYDDRLLYDGGGGLYGSLEDMRTIMCDGISEEDFNSTEALDIFTNFCTDGI